ncbi:hypothetical protein U9M48_039820 [Paspalum notatum var. saurae]|uniref:Reverse transcriptase domain-containing protein n=1 Tax=Paspalum notatum var. saurae TaxID=547442 RepID=A0AAQ3XEZ0_PASNO
MRGGAAEQDAAKLRNSRGETAASSPTRSHIGPPRKRHLGKPATAKHHPTRVMAMGSCMRPWSLLQSQEEAMKMTPRRDIRKNEGYSLSRNWSKSVNTVAGKYNEGSIQNKLWQLVSTEAEEENCEEEDSGDDLMSVSVHAAQGVVGKKTIVLNGFLGQQKVMLADSGSSHSFVSEHLAVHITGWKELSKAIRVRVADGAELLCTHELAHKSWLVQGQQFTSSFKILPLKCYDIILGIDWLESHSPVEIDWVNKWISFRYKSQQVKLQGKGAVHPELQPVLQSYADLFSEPTGLPPTRSMMHTIPLMAGATPFRLRPYRYTPLQKDEIERQVAKLLQTNMIQRSRSPYASPVLLVKKKCGEWRLSVDFRRLNAYTIKNKFPIPIVEELFEELHGAQWFTTLDLRSGFHQILVAEEDRYKTAFQTHQGHYEYKVMPYGLTSAPATFQSVMNFILASLLRKCAVVFIDDILIYSKSIQEHAQHVQQVFQLLREHQFKGVYTDPAKIADVQKCPVPQSAKEFISFLGLVGYYRRFIRNFGLVAKPLTDLLKKGAMFLWSHDADQAFLALKQALSSAPVLALPNFKVPFTVVKDASDKGIGAVLEQGGHPIAFLSRPLAEFIIKTDHRSLVNLDNQRLHTYWQHKAMAKLMGLQYRICYKKGSSNRAADALSRMPTNTTATLAAVSVSQLQAKVERVTWELWKHRNACVFEGTRPDVSVVLQNIANEGSLWCAAGAKGLRSLLEGAVLVLLYFGFFPSYFFLLNEMKRSSPAFSRKRKQTSTNLSLNVLYVSKLKWNEFLTQGYFSHLLSLTKHGK